MFRLVISEARHLIAQRNTIERLAGELLGEHADFRRLQQVPGIGPINALAILAEAGGRAMSKVVLHPTYAERPWLITADRNTGALYEDGRPCSSCNARALVGWSQPLIPARGG